MDVRMLSYQKDSIMINILFMASIFIIVVMDRIILKRKFKELSTKVGNFIDWQKTKRNEYKDYDDYCNFRNKTLSNKVAYLEGQLIQLRVLFTERTDHKKNREEKLKIMRKRIVQVDLKNQRRAGIDEGA